jgi:two-component system sensor kinase FixL
MIMDTDRVQHLLDEVDQLSRRLAEKEGEIEKMRMSNLFLETLFDGINEEIVVIDQHFTIHDASKVFLKRYGLQKQEVLGRKCHEVAYQSDEPCRFGKQMCPLEKAKKTKQRVEVTHYHEREGGEVKELARIIYPLFEAGTDTQYFIEISRDVTEYRNLIRKLKSSEKKFKAILDTATSAILSIDEAHQIILFNNAAKRIFGYAGDEVIGKDLSMLIPPQYGDHYRYVKRFLESKTPRVIGRNLSLTGLRKNGEEFPIELGLSHHETKDGVTFTAIIRDVSIQKKLEKKLLQSERLAAVGQAVAHVAHEIKNPLMIIGGFSQQIRSCLSDEKAIQKLDLITDEVSRLEKLVANVGDFTKGYKLVKRSADIGSVILDVLRIMGEIYPSEKYQFSADFSSSLKEVNCDPDKLKQVFMNIIANGIEAMENGGEIKIVAQSWPEGVEIRIRDQGSGISEEDQLHIFEPFYTTRARGSGLGLSISYKIVEAHQGEIWADSIPGEGTTFIIRLPA